MKHSPLRKISKKNSRKSKKKSQYVKHWQKDLMDVVNIVVENQIGVGYIHMRRYFVAMAVNYRYPILRCGVVIAILFMGII